MNKAQNYQLNMHLTYQTVLNENAGKFTIPAYPGVKADIVNSIATEQILANAQDTLKHSSTAPKIASRNAAGKVIFELASGISAYAIVTGNMELTDKVRISETELNRISDGAFLHRAETILKCGAENLPGLADYEITQQTLTDAETLLNDFRAEIQKQAMRKIELKETTKQLSKQIKITDKLIKPVDAMVEPKRLSDPDWYSLYWNARSIKKGAAGRVAASGKVYDAETNLPLPGAIMTVVRAVTGKALSGGAELVKNVKIKSASGGFQLKSLPTGAYIFRVTYAGYADQEVTVYINDGVLSKVDMPLSRIA